MGWLNDPLPNWVQWLGLATTVLGTGLAFWAAPSATRASRIASEARAAAVRIGRTLELSDLLSDMQELHAMLARRDFESITAKASNLRGRVVRFKVQAYTLLLEEYASDLDTARTHLESIESEASSSRTVDATKILRISSAWGHAFEALNRVFGIQQLTVHGVGDDHGN